MNKLPTFIQLEGILYESLEFEYRQGYETRTAPRRVNETNSVGVTALLVDDNDEPLVSMTPDIRFPMGCGPGMPNVGLHELRVSLPMHPEARSIQFRAQDRLIFRREIGKTVPSEVVIEAKPQKAGDSISFSLVGPRDANTELFVFLETENKRQYPIPVELVDDSLSIDLKRFSGLGEAKIIVRHSSAFRSIESSSAAFKLPERSTCGRILGPSANAVLPAGFPFSMIGSLYDENGRLIEWGSFKVFWCVDGTRIDDPRQIALCAPLKSGEHKIELFVTKDGKESVLLHQVSIRVKQRSKAQHEYDAIVERYLASKKTVQRLPDAASAY